MNTTNEPKESPHQTCHCCVDCREGETTQFIYSIGLSPERPISFDDSTVFEPVNCLPNEDVVKSMTFDKQETLYDFGIAAAYLWLVDAQVVVKDEDAKELAIRTWNALTSLYYLSGLSDADICPCIQCTTSAAELNEEGRMHALPTANCGLPKKRIKLDAERCALLEKQVANGMSMINDKIFYRAAHALWSYKWISADTSQMAIIWSGIEALFGVQSELSFRLSYEASVFLDLGIDGFKQIKKLYTERSKAVHSRSPISSKAVSESAELLRSLIIKCSELKCLPSEEALLFR